MYDRKHCEKSNFSFSHNVFHSYISLVHQNAVLCGNESTLQGFHTLSRLLMTLKENSFESIVGKVENTGNQHFPYLT